MDRNHPRARASTMRLLALGTAGALVAFSAAACHRNESNPQAAQISQHGYETSEVLTNRAVELQRGPRTQAVNATIQDLQQSANTLAQRADELAARVRASNARGGGPADSQATYDAIVNARCEVAARCGQIGPGSTHATVDACIARLGHDDFLGWTPNTCGGRPFEPAHLDNCLSAIRVQTCTATDVATVQRYCAPTAVCPQR